MKNIACADGTVATKVRAILARYGILRGVYHKGPRIQDPRIQLVVSVPVDQTYEAAIRRELEMLGGATIQD